MKPAPPRTRKTRLGDTALRNADTSTGLPTGGLAYADTAVVDAPTSIGPEVAAKLAVAELLRGFTAHDVQMKAILGGDTRPAQVVHLASGAVSLNWPENGVLEAPLKMTISEQGVFSYDECGLSGPSMLTETVDKFGPGTVLMLEADVTGQLAIELVVAASSVRDAVRLALRRLFAMEPGDTRTSRTVVLASYYDCDIRLSLPRQAFEPDDSMVQQGKWGLLCRLDVEVPSVRLVGSPGFFQTVQVPTE